MAITLNGGDALVVRQLLRRRAGLQKLMQQIQADLASVSADELEAFHALQRFGSLVAPGYDVEHEGPFRFEPRKDGTILLHAVEE